MNGVVLLLLPVLLVVAVKVLNSLYLPPSCF